MKPINANSHYYKCCKTCKHRSETKNSNDDIQCSLNKQYYSMEHYCIMFEMRKQYKNM